MNEFYVFGRNFYILLMYENYENYRYINGDNYDKPRLLQKIGIKLNQISKCKKYSFVPAEQTSNVGQTKEDWTTGTLNMHDDVR